MALTRDEVLRVAELARLELSEAEIDTFTRQLGDILAYVEALQLADTTGTAATSHVFATETIWREDALQPSLDRDRLLSQAPDAAPASGLFRVPKVL